MLSIYSIWIVRNFIIIHLTHLLFSSGKYLSQFPCEPMFIIYWYFHPGSNSRLFVGHCDNYDRIHSSICFSSVQYIFHGILYTIFKFIL